MTVHEYGEFSLEKMMTGTDSVGRAQLLADYYLVLYVADVPTASNGPTVRLTWLPLTASNLPMYAREIPVVFVSMENPYHLRDVPRVQTFVNAYCNTVRNVGVVADKLLGLDGFRGTSPVDPFCGYPEARY